MDTGFSTVWSSSSSSRNSKTRSAAAAVDWSMLATWATWAMGWLKLRTYWIKDWISPTSMVFLDRQPAAQDGNHHIPQVAHKGHDAACIMPGEKLGFPGGIRTGYRYLG